MQKIEIDMYGDYKLYEKVLQYGIWIAAVFILASFIPYLTEMPILFSSELVSAKWHLSAEEMRQLFQAETQGVRALFYGDMLAYLGVITISSLSFIMMFIVCIFYIKNKMFISVFFTFGNTIIIFFGMSGLAHLLFSSN